MHLSFMDNHETTVFFRNLNKIVPLQKISNILEITALEQPTSLAMTEKLIPLAFIWKT